MYITLGKGKENGEEGSSEGDEYREKEKLP